MRKPLRQGTDLLTHLFEQGQRRSACLLWPWATRNGYGAFRLDGRVEYVHVYVYKAAHGELPQGYEVCHTCDTRRCFEPAHLFKGTRSENMLDAAAKGRLERPKGEKHHMAKLTDENVRYIRQQAAVGASHVALATQFGCCSDHISRVVHRRRRQEVA